VTPERDGFDLDVGALIRVLDQVEGRRFIGAVIGGQCLELVFEGDRGGNLVSIYVLGRHAGAVVLGGVANPEEYAKAGGRWRPWGMRP
jgi:hypothetical protein